MSAIYNGLIEAVQSKIGVLALILLLGNIYQGWLYQQIRQDQKSDRSTAKDEAAAHVKAFESIATTLSSLTIGIAEIRGHMFGRDSRR